MPNPSQMSLAEAEAEVFASETRLSKLRQQLSDEEDFHSVWNNVVFQLSKTETVKQ